MNDDFEKAFGCYLLGIVMLLMSQVIVLLVVAGLLWSIYGRLF